MFTAERLRALVPTALPDIIAKCAPALDTYASEFGVTTPLRAAYFAAQIAYESAGFSKLIESLFYSAERIAAVWPRLAARSGALASNPEALGNAAYAGRIGNGDENSGDGWRYRGRGLIQLTGKNNYLAAAEALNIILMKNPAVAADTATASLISLWFWSSHRCNQAADRDDIEAVTRLINPALEGINARKALTDRAKAIFAGTDLIS